MYKNFTKKLEKMLINTTIDLIDVFSYIEENEYIGPENKGYVFSEFLKNLTSCEGNAYRLYNCFIKDYEDFVVFNRLYDMKEYLSKQEQQEVETKAKSIFDIELLLNFYG